MGKPPAFPLYAADFYMDTVGWSNEEIGTYFRLLMVEWVNGSLPNNAKQLQRITHLGAKKWKKVSQTVLTKFRKRDDGNLVNPKMETIRIEQEEYRKQCSDAGKRGVAKKKQMGVFPFNKSSPPSSDPASENQALQSSSSSSSLKQKEPEAFSLPSREEIHESSMPKVKSIIEKVVVELYETGIFTSAPMFKNRCFKVHVNARTILHTFCRIYNAKPKDSWAYGVAIMKVEDGNFNERDFRKTT